MNKSLTLILLVVCGVFASQSQLRVVSNGNILTGKMQTNTNSVVEPGIVPFNAGDILIKTDTTYNREAGINVFSPFDNKPAFISFGVKKVTIGESLTHKLNLSGFLGMEGYVNEIPVFNCSRSGSFRFFRDIETTGLYQNSDINLKTDIEDLMPSRAEDLILLRPVSYRYSSELTPQGVDKESQTKFGLIAQEVQEIYPELVRENEDGTLSIDYIGLIPLMLAKINNLQNQLDAITTTISQAPASVGAITGATICKLYQNIPNPFKSTTTITCDLPENIQQAAIYIYDLQGQQITKLPIKERGNASVIMQGESLRPGMYIYALIADGREIDAKRMIITE